MVQVATPTREAVEHYKDERAEIERLVGEINGRFSRIGLPVVHYLYQTLPYDELVALYRAGDVMLVTPFRDGMNLVAKEYAAAHIDGDGVLVLSEFAGAADELTDAVQVNPHDDTSTGGCDRRSGRDAPPRASRTDGRPARPDPQERRAGMGRAFPGRTRRGVDDGHLVVTTSDRSDSLDQIDAVETVTDAITGLPRPLLLVFDCDGVLAPLIDHADDSVLNDGVGADLERLSEASDVTVAILSGRSLDGLAQFDFVDSIVVAGSYGGERRGADIEELSRRRAALAGVAGCDRGRRCRSGGTGCVGGTQAHQRGGPRP